jgi:hypothetical protein
MDIVTIACPVGFTDENVVDNAPIWLGANGVEYKVASGMLEGYTTSDPIEATSDRVNVVVGIDGLEALAAMGLTVKESEE